MFHSMLRGAALLLLVAAVTGCSRSHGAVVVAGPGPAAAESAPSTAVALGVPPGHLPPPGRCRVWIPGDPPGRQAPPRSCDGILAAASAGSMVLHRPTRDRNHIHVTYVDEQRAGVAVQVVIFEAASGRFVREDRPEGR